MSKLDKFKAKNSLALALKLTTQTNKHNLLKNSRKSPD